MKSLIEYYYNVNISRIRMIEGKYHFLYNGQEYIFEQFKENKDAPNSLKFILQLSTMNENFHSIILNKERKVLTYDGEELYILLKVNLKNNRIINLNDIMQSTIPVSSNTNATKWKTLWEEKIDNFEYYINYIQDKKEEDSEFYDYFIGLGEAAISYVSLVENEKRNHMDITVISHNRINTKYTLYDLYNPLNIVLDHYTRDLAEYLKSAFFNDKEINIKNIINNLNMSEYASILLISRMLFPTFFFDLYELEIKDKVLKTKKLINKMDSYEAFIYKLILEIKKRINIPTIKWLHH